MTSSSGPGRRVGARTAERVDDLELLACALREFGIHHEVVSVTDVGRAWSNRVWSVRTSAGHFAVKELLNPWNDPMWREWLDQAIRFERRATEAGVHAPAQLVTAAGEALVDLNARTFRAHVWVENAEPCPGGPVTESIARSVARDLATMHALQAVPARDDVFPTATTATCDGWPELVAELRRRGSSYADAAGAIEGEVTTIRDWLLRRTSCQNDTFMSHGDVDQKNLLLADGAVWLVDWDVAAPWSPAEEAMRTAISLAGWRDPTVVDTFLSAYVSEGGGPFAPDATLLAQDLVIGLDWLDRCVRIAAGLLPADPRRRAEARQQAASGLHALPTRVRIAADLPHWTTKPHRTRQSHTFGA